MSDNRVFGVTTVTVGLFPARMGMRNCAPKGALMVDTELQFVQLLTSHQGRLFAYVLSLVGDSDQSRDVM